MLLVTVSDEESRRIEQQSDEETKAEVMEVLREMFGKDIPEAIDILVPRWWSDRFFKGTFSNWPIGVNKNEDDEIRVTYHAFFFFFFFGLYILFIIYYLPTPYSYILISK